MATYSAAVERWRPLVQKYFPPELVDKALYVIQGESGGNPTIRGDNGVAIGLFQIQDNRNFEGRPDASWLENAENNIKYAAQQLGAAQGRWSDWGEGSSYNGQAFGALGHNPYPGDDGDYSGNSNTWDDSMGTGGSYDPAMYVQIQTEVRESYQDWLDAGSPGEDSDEEGYRIWARKQEAVAALNDFQSVYGIDPRATGAGDANDKIGQWATIEGVDMAKAAAAFDRWKTKHDQAFGAAQDEITSAQGQNTERIAIQEARNQSSTPGLLPRNLTAGTVTPAYAPTLAKWKDKYGATDQMPPSSGYVQPPSLDTPGAPGTGTGGNIAPGSKPSDHGEWQGPINPDGQTMPGGTVITQNPDGSRTGAGTWGEPRPDPWQGPINPDYAPDGTTIGPPGDPGPSLFDSVLDSGIFGVAPKKAAKSVGGKVKKWWQKNRFFADGGTDLPGGPAIVGEKGPEIYWDGIKMHVVGKNGPEQIMIADGGSIIPMSEAMAMQGIKKGMGGPPSGSGDAMSRESDPQVREKAMAAAQSAISAALAMNPPSTPVPIDGSKDYFANWRELSGVPYDPMAAAPAQGGAPRG